MPKVRAVDEPDQYKSDTAAATTKTETPLKDVPQSVSIITRQSIDDLNMQNLGEAMRYVPGVSMAQGEGNRETPVIRGSSSTGDFFLDSMRDDVQYYRDLYNIERVEVLRGPNGAIFGRGGVGGLINRVSKEAGSDPLRQFIVQFGTESNQRATIDFGQGLNDALAVRVNGMYEDSDSYRDDVTLQRYGVNPTMTWHAGDRTKVTFGVEYFHDERIADRGVSSYQGRPLDTDPSTFFGDPAQSPTDTTVKMANSLVEHYFSETIVLRNRTRYADYDKFYQNVFPGAVNSAGTLVLISAYNNAMERENFFNQTDLNFSLATGAIEHKFLAGVELGRQKTQNLRKTGFFDTQGFGTASVNVPVSNPRTTLPVTFRPNGTDADNNGTAKIAALYAQDEIAFSEQFLVTAGLRFDDFKVDFRNNRSAADFSSEDKLWSPRLGLVYKPQNQLSLYASYGKTYQPRAGDQLSSLSLTNESLDPEEFTNIEAGAKWDPNANLAFTAAVFQLDRTNVAVTVPDPAAPLTRTITVLVDGQRNKGVELGLAGKLSAAWSVLGSFTYQDAELTTAQSSTLQKGATLANVPKTMFSLWNRYDISRSWGVGIGVIHRAELFAATEDLATPANNVTLPSFTRVDGAVYFTINEHWRAQLNVENLLDEEYFQFANGNTNITPGSPLAARAVITATF